MRHKQKKLSVVLLCSNNKRAKQLTFQLAKTLQILVVLGELPPLVERRFFNRLYLSVD